MECFSSVYEKVMYIMLITHLTFLLFLSTAVIAQDTGSLCNPFEGMCEGIFLKMEMVIIILRAFSSAFIGFLEIVLLVHYRMLKLNKSVPTFVI